MAKGKIKKASKKVKKVAKKQNKIKKSKESNFKRVLNFDKVLAKMKMNAKGKEAKLPEFAIKGEPKLIILPEAKEGMNVKYHLIEPFAYVNITWDNKRKEIIYNLVEPKLTPEDNQNYDKIVKGLMDILEIDLSSLKKSDEVIDYLEEQIKKVITEYDIKLEKSSYLNIMYYVFRNFVGLNEIEPLMRDPYIQDISCNGVNTPLFIVHRKYGSIKTNVVYENTNDLKEFVVKLSERTGRFISYAEPLLDGTLPDGSRIQASFTADVTTRGPSFTIRKFVKEPLSPIDLMNSKTINSEMLAYLWLAVESGSSILIGGGAATGKTTMLNVISMFIPQNAKIITIEDTREINLKHENWVPSVTRGGFAKGYGEVTLFDLLREAFRQSPDYVLVGEVRGQEAYVMFQGMAAGFPCMGTMHGGRVEDIIYRLQTPPISLSPSLIETLDIVLIMTHALTISESARRVREIVEIQTVDPKSGSAITTRTFGWIASEDSFESLGQSTLLQDVSKIKGVAMEELQIELKNRKAILDTLQKKGMNKFEDVFAVISSYKKNPEKVLKEFNIKAP